MKILMSGKTVEFPSEVSLPLGELLKEVNIKTGGGSVYRTADRTLEMGSMVAPNDTIVISTPQSNGSI